MYSYDSGEPNGPGIIGMPAAIVQATVLCERGESRYSIRLFRQARQTRRSRLQRWPRAHIQRGKRGRSFFDLAVAENRHKLRLPIRSGIDCNEWGALPNPINRVSDLRHPFELGEVPGSPLGACGSISCRRGWRSSLCTR
jgi:hypothetical protein